MHKGKIRGLRRFLELKSVRETPPKQLWSRMSNPNAEGDFMQKALLTGSESYQIYGAVHMVGRFGASREAWEKKLLAWLVLYILNQSGNGHIRISREDLMEDFPLWLKGASVKIPEDHKESYLSDILSRNERLFASLPEGRAPIVISADGESFYLLKRWRYEQRFLQLLEALIGEKGHCLFPGWENPRTALEEAYGLLSQDPSLLMGPETLQAAEMTSTRLLSVITGGPGTGKTTLLGGMLRLLLEAGHSSGTPPLNIRLCAPTGRAAGRMEESLQGVLHDPSYESSFPIAPCTLHKLLGLVPGSPPRFNRNRPLSADLIVVDEASMVDLNLMYYILDALQPGARLLLLGDKDQLPSVEAGALLSDFLHGLGHPAYALEGGVLSLSRVHRNSGAILEGAGLIIRGETEEFLSFLGQPARKKDRDGRRSTEDSEGDGLFFYQDIPDFPSFLDSMGKEFGLKELKNKIPPFNCPVSHWEDQREEINSYFQLFRDRVILAPSRRGLFGINSLNRALSAHIAEGEGPVFHGQPIMITRNDYERDLFNGDRGVVLTFNGQSFAFFEDSCDKGFRFYPVSLLGEYQTAFALTIHKSQGSEYGHVTLIIPEGVERLLSREILYTGITRAREQVHLISRRELMERSLSRGVRRHSGIREFMCRPL
ncbi:MAG: hypothetical protein B6241_06415 [Spirochaetaceae bacterium 4572_59]|nr:MAG: hypothetical protein B6241_06415 [Spirochaetaceae bacterium 4572_59]